ncbi:MAG TPA: HAMP domain-containing sensor histidine kinase [Vicinamibacteria bacterium]|nr:HAMP domain-containing sensor histidine kinase [Vicinamibacteria bacterium]
MRRLSHQIYLTVVGVLVLFALLVSGTWFFALPWREEQGLAEGYASTVAELLPAPERPPVELQAAVARLAARLRIDAAVFSADGTPLASAGRPLPSPQPGRSGSHWLRLRGRGFAVALRLPDGRFFVARSPHAAIRGHGSFLVALGLLAAAVAVGAWPVTRRLTRRLERLRHRVEDLGGGDLQARATIEGRDEVADLAKSFNRAAERIEDLVTAERRMLAFASHELRSPLARLRVSLEMMVADPALRAGAERDLAELDGLIGELLEASRLTALGTGAAEDVDLLALAAEEAARTGADAGGVPVVVRGDPRLLRRLVRNLLENGRRHGGGSAVEARVEPGRPSGARLTVADRGPGVPEAERERIFEPFHRPSGTAESGEGYGLGLALVRQIARAHGGEARCLPREGGGSLFEVVLA